MLDRYSTMKRLIEEGNYNKQDFERKISLYIRADVMTLQEADELRMMMLEKEGVNPLPL